MQVIKTKYGYIVEPHKVGANYYRHNGEYLGNEIEDNYCYQNHKEYLYETGGRTGYLYCTHPSHYDGNEVEIVSLSARERSEFYFDDYLIVDTCHGRWKCRYNQGTIFVLKNQPKEKNKNERNWNTYIRLLIRLNRDELRVLDGLFNWKFGGTDFLDSHVVRGRAKENNNIEITVFNPKGILENNGLCSVILELNKDNVRRRVVLKSNIDKKSFTFDKKTTLQILKEFLNICNSGIKEVEKLIMEV